MFLFRVLHRLFGSRNTACLTWYIENSDRRDSQTTTPYVDDRNQAFSWSMQHILTVCTEFLVYSSTVELQVREDLLFLFGRLNEIKLEPLETLQH